MHRSKFHNSLEKLPRLYTPFHLVEEKQNGDDGDAQEEKKPKRSEKEKEFWQYFQRLVTSWNPCYDDEGRFRYVWDEEVGAHDVHVVDDIAGVPQPAQPKEPERTRLREVLDRVLGSAVEGEALDLEPIRSLVGKLVQSSVRHKDHGSEGPKFGVDACAAGSSKCPVCRYGFPHKLCCPDACELEKKDQEGSWA